MSALDLANAISSNLKSLQPGTLRFWGNWFGKPYDNIHQIVGSLALQDLCLLYFDHAEVVMVEEPSNWQISNGSLRIQKAKRIKLQWFSYGEIPERDNLIFQEYCYRNSVVEIKTSCNKINSFAMTDSFPALEIISMMSLDT